MTFWSDRVNVIEPVRAYRFKVSFGDDSEVWWAKTVSKPSFETTAEEYTLINHTFKYPGITKWSDITIKTIDFKKKEKSSEVFKIYDFLEKSGYNPKGSGSDGMSKKLMYRDCVIRHLDSNGNALETWTLYNAFIKNVEFSELSYESDDISEITITLAYDRAILE